MKFLKINKSRIRLSQETCVFNKLPTSIILQDKKLIQIFIKVYER